MSRFRKKKDMFIRTAGTAVNVKWEIDKGKVHILSNGWLISGPVLLSIYYHWEYPTISYNIDKKMYIRPYFFFKIFDAQKTKI